MAAPDPVSPVRPASFRHWAHGLLATPALSPISRLVALAIGLSTEPNGQGAWLTYKDIGGITGLPADTARRYAVRLRALGWLERTGHDGPWFITWPAGRGELEAIRAAGLVDVADRRGAIAPAAGAIIPDHHAANA